MLLLQYALVGLMWLPAGRSSLSRIYMSEQLTYLAECMHSPQCKECMRWLRHLLRLSKFQQDMKCELLVLWHHSKSQLRMSVAFLGSSNFLLRKYRMLCLRLLDRNNFQLCTLLSKVQSSQLHKGSRLHTYEQLLRCLLVEYTN